MTRTLFRGDQRTRMASVGALSLALALLASGCGGEAPTPPTAKVERATVATKVSASGALSAITSQNLGFPKGAQLKEITVKVGDMVQPGQVLARLDDFAFNQLLNQQRSQLLNQQAQLDRLLNGNTVEQAERSLDQARKIQSATERNVSAQLKADDTAISRAKVALDNAERQKSQAERNVDFCRAHSPTSAQGTAPIPAMPADPNTTPPTPATPAVPGMPPGPPPIRPPGGFFHNGPSNPQPQPSYGDRDRDGVVEGDDENYYSQGEGGTDPCTVQVNRLNQARTEQVQAKTTYEQAKKQRRVDETQGRVSIEQAKQNVVTAQNNRDTAGNDTPANIEAQRALVANAVAAVALAQRDVDNTVLYAPVAGVVRNINGAIGEFLGVQSGTTQVAPGTDAAIPGVGVAAPSQAGGNVITDTRGGSGNFITLSNVNTFQVVVPFEESDAAKVAPNQQVEVSFDALPDLTRAGRVLALAPAGTDISGVTNYYATIVLTESDPRLRDGQTAEAGVLTSARENVLTVPNNAVITQGGRSFVTTPGPDGAPVQTPFQPGLVGDDRTEVLSGLTEGQEILLPQAQVTPTPGGGQGGGGNR